MVDSPETLCHAPGQGEDMLLNLTPVRDTREEGEVLENSPAHARKAMEKVRVEKQDYPHPQRCCYVKCDLDFKSKDVFAKHIMNHMKQGD